MGETARGAADAATNVQDMHVGCKGSERDQLPGRLVAADMEFVDGLQVVRGE